MDSFFTFLILLFCVVVLRVLRPHPGRFSRVWWILGKLVIHTSMCMQARWRSDFGKGCVLQRLPAQIRMYQITLLTPLYLSAQHYLFALFHSSFCHLPLVTFFLRFPLSHCLLDMLMFQSWWVTWEFSCCPWISSSLTQYRKRLDCMECMKKKGQKTDADAE